MSVSEGRRKGWKGVAEASPSSGELVALFSSHCNTRARRKKGGCLGSQASGHCQQVCSPGFTSLKGVVSCPGPPPTTEPQRIQIPHRLQGSDFTQLTTGDLIWEGQLRKDRIAQSKQRDRPQQKRPLQCVLIIMEIWRPTHPPWRPGRPCPSGALAYRPEQHGAGPSRPKQHHPGLRPVARALPGQQGESSVQWFRGWSLQIVRQEDPGELID